VSDPTVRGVTAAARTQELLHEVQANPGQVYLVVNRTNGALPPEVEGLIQQHALNLLATIPSDPGVADLDARGRPLVELDSSSPVRKAVSQIAQELGLTRPGPSAGAPSRTASPAAGVEDP
jgi:CO dehydrogenase nickel-insertion accessory protein CooC1